MNVENRKIGVVRLEIIFKFGLLLVLVLIALALFRIGNTIRYDVKQMKYFYIVYDKLDGSFVVNPIPLKKIKEAQLQMQEEYSGGNSLEN